MHEILCTSFKYEISMQLARVTSYCSQWLLHPAHRSGQNNKLHVQLIQHFFMFCMFLRKKTVIYHFYMWPFLYNLTFTAHIPLWQDVFHLLHVCTVTLWHMQTAVKSWFMHWTLSLMSCCQYHWISNFEGFSLSN